VLSIFSGYLLVWSVTASLHTPLMAVTNAISGIIMIGCIISMN
jgi:NAD(P) transhydrogenase subunit alpha